MNKYYSNVYAIIFLLFIISHTSHSCKQKKAYKPNINVGADAPDFSLPDRNNVVHKLSDYKNKTILLDFWASWCGPCRKKNKDVVALYHKYKNTTFSNGSTLEIISISQDNKEDAWLRAIEDDGLEWNSHLKQRLAGLSEASIKYDVQYIPTTFLINSSGKIMLVNPSIDEIEEKLEGMR